MSTGKMGECGWDISKNILTIAPKENEKRVGRKPERHLWRTHQRKYPECPKNRPVGSGMKRRELIRELENIGCVLVRHRAKHDWYHNPKTKISQPVPRHREINEQLPRHRIKMLGDQTQHGFSQENRLEHTTTTRKPDRHRRAVSGRDL